MLRKTFVFLSFLFMSLAALYCITLFISYPLSENNEVDISSVLTSSKTDNENIKQDESQEIEQSDSNQNNSALATAALNDEAKGKIVTKSVDVSNAPLRYNNVSVKNTTSLNIDLKAELLAGPSIKLQNTNEPQVLIMHTHTTECYMLEERDYYTEKDLSRTTDDSENIVAVGEILKTGLENKGIGVIHAMEKHDYPEYTGSYTRSAETVKKYLEKYSTIKVVIDLHRDAIMDSNETKTALVSEINGKRAAQLMIVAGCEDGDVTGYQNWRQNFRLAVKLQQSMEVMYPGLARPMLLKARKYNQNLTEGSILIECGTDANTLEQAKYSASLLSDCLAFTLNMIKED